MVREILPEPGPARVGRTGRSVELATARGLGRGKRSEPNPRGVAKARGRACSSLLACPDQGPGLGAPQHQQSCGKEKPMSEQPAGGFGRMQEEMLARLNELMHSLLETNPLLRAARRADELPQPVRDLLHGLTGYAGLAVQPLSLFVDYQRDLADQMARWARLQREFAEQMAAWAERYRQFADTMGVLLTPLPEAFHRAAHFVEAQPDDDSHQGG